MKNIVKNVFVVVIIMVTLVGLLSGCTNSKDTKTSDNSQKEKYAKELNFFNWSEYMPDSVLKKFQEEYGIKVNYSTYSSNEEMLAKIMAGGTGQYDLAVASDYMVATMIHQSLLEKIDKDKITNLKNIGDVYLNKDYDPGNEYSVPYMAGSALIAVNTKKVKFPIKGYSDLWNPTLKSSLVVLDDERAVIGMTLKKMGYSMNETDPAVLNKAKLELEKLMPNIKAYDSDSPKTLLINGEAAAGYVWNAEAFLAQQENPDIQIVIPEEGMYLFEDNFVIPKNAPHKKEAELLINFVLRPDISAMISKAFPYTNPNMEARKLIDKKIINNIAVYPPEEAIKKGEYIKDVGDKLRLYDEIWSEIKQ
ncbi:MAG: spermidine/putrescine transport system substrate-binding protein potC [Tepidanaerobacteraceae bacterium]|nr:spermidine/putrescine transport system substrate-binding protein potC [Tepidanaerobacteraceae bacterium]